MFLLASYEAAGLDAAAGRTAGFAVVGIGAVGCVLAGVLADRVGRTTITAQRPRFHRGRAPSKDERERLPDTLIRRTVRTLIQAGALVVESEEEGAQPYLNLERPDDDALAALPTQRVILTDTALPTVHGAVAARAALARPTADSAGVLSTCRQPPHSTLAATDAAPDRRPPSTPRDPIPMFAIPVTTRNLGV